MRKRSAIVALSIFLILVSIVWILTSGGTVMARAEKQSAERTYSVVVKRFGGRIQTELLAGKYLVSSYVFYQGSVPPTDAVISWPMIDEFLVTFDNGTGVHCTWNSSTYGRLCWERL